MSYSADEQYTIYDEQFPRARKEHTCEACRETIPGGVRYARIFVLFDGEKKHYKRCLRCQAIHEHLRGLCLEQGDMWPDERLNCGQAYEEEWGETPPEIAELAFLSPGDVQTTGQLEDTDRNMAYRRTYKKTGSHVAGLAACGHAIFPQPPRVSHPDSEVTG